jgi:hypothetical protein
MEVQVNNDDIDLVYQEIISPENFKQNFSSKRDFLVWLNKGSKSNLDFALKKYEEQEMYEHCSIIRDFIKNKFTN